MYGPKQLLGVSVVRAPRRIPPCALVLVCLAVARGVRIGLIPLASVPGADLAAPCEENALLCVYLNRRRTLGGELTTGVSPLKTKQKKKKKYEKKTFETQRRNGH